MNGFFVQRGITYNWSAVEGRDLAGSVIVVTTTRASDGASATASTRSHRHLHRTARIAASIIGSSR